MFIMLTDAKIWTLFFLDQKEKKNQNQNQFQNKSNIP